MGDRRRFDLFADLIQRLVPDRSARIADVAAGKGYLSWALRQRGFKHTTPFEPNPRRGGQVTRLGMHVRDFTPGLARDYDVLVGMHPDDATDCILSGAAIARTTAIVVPCCTRPRAWSYWGQRRSYVEWMQHLTLRSQQAGLSIRETTLPMTGRNRVLVASPDVRRA